MSVGTLAQSTKSTTINSYFGQTKPFIKQLRLTPTWEFILRKVLPSFTYLLDTLEGVGWGDRTRTCDKTSCSQNKRSTKLSYTPVSYAATGLTSVRVVKVDNLIGFKMF